MDDVEQSEMIDSAINGVLQSLDPYSAYMGPELFKEMQTDTRGEFGGLNRNWYGGRCGKSNFSNR